MLGAILQRLIMDRVEAGIPLEQALLHAPWQSRVERAVQQSPGPSAGQGKRSRIDALKQQAAPRGIAATRSDSQIR
jgi:hypothetical protein